MLNSTFSFFKFSSTPNYFIWLKYLSWFNYANELMNINQWSGVKNITCNDDNNLCTTEGEQILKKLEMKEVFEFESLFIYYLMS